MSPGDLLETDLATVFGNTASAAGLAAAHLDGIVWVMSNLDGHHLMQAAEREHHHRVLAVFADLDLAEHIRDHLQSMTRLSRRWGVGPLSLRLR